MKHEHDVVPLLSEYLDLEMDLYVSGREGRADKLLAERLHKMFYGYREGSRGRGSASGEHPKNWPAPVRAAAEARLAEVGWPW